MTRDDRIDKVLQQVAEEYNVGVDDIMEIYDNMGKFILHKIQEINFREMDSSTFRETKKNFNIPSLCKIYVNENAFKKINKIELNEEGN